MTYYKHFGWLILALYVGYWTISAMVEVGTVLPAQTCPWWTPLLIFSFLVLPICVAYELGKRSVGNETEHG